MLNAYLTFPGTCAQAIAFYVKVFHGTVEMSMTHGESPMREHVSADWHDKIIHTTVRFADGVLMASDAPPQMYKTPQGFSVSVSVSPAEAERIFPLLAEGGTVNMALQKTFWAERFGVVIDRFGIPWMVSGGSVANP